jgi:hypothetical protein
MRKAKMLAAILLLAATPAAAERLTLYSLATGDRFVEFGRQGGVGDLILWNSELQDAQGNKVGTDTGSCIRVDAAGNHLCNIVIDHAGHGKMNFNGVQLTEPQISTLTILGGTDDYEGATGVIRSTPVEDRARFRYQIDYRTD